MSSPPGARCVDSFIAPRMEQFFRAHAIVRPLCLQLEPDTHQPENEAIRLRERGHMCVVALANRQAYSRAWREPPAAVDPFLLPFPDNRFHFIVTGAFAKLAAGAGDRQRLASEIFRVCSSPGAVLLTCANRYCPLDLSGKRLHWFLDKRSAGLHELERFFGERCGFRVVTPLNLAGHFEWSSLAARLSPLANICESYVRWITRPDWRMLYASPLNPVLGLWLEK